MATSPAALAGLERQVCAAVGTILNSDPRPRELIAAEMSILTGDEISRAMLDAYSSPAREDHRVILSRFVALVLVCGRQDIFDAVLRPAGMALLVGAEVNTARLGHIDQQIAALSEERRRLKSAAPLIRGGKTA